MLLLRQTSGGQEHHIGSGVVTACYGVLRQTSGGQEHDIGSGVVTACYGVLRHQEARSMILVLVW